MLPFLGLASWNTCPGEGTQPILHDTTTPETGGTIIILPLQLRKRKGSSNRAFQLWPASLCEGRPTPEICERKKWRMSAPGRFQGDRKGRSLGDCVAPTIHGLRLAIHSCMVGAGLAPI